MRRVRRMGEALLVVRFTPQRELVEEKEMISRAETSSRLRVGVRDFATATAQTP